MKERPLRSLLAAAVAGALPVLAFPEPSLWWLAPVALVPAMLVISGAAGGREAALLAWAAGTGYLIGATHWLTPKIGPGMLIFSALVGITFVPWGAVMFTTRRRGLPLILGAPLVGAAWLASEAIRSWQSLGGPWGLYGATQTNDRFLLRLAAVGGVWLIGWFLVSVNWCIALAVRERFRRAEVLTAVTAIVLGVGAAGIVGEPTRVGELRIAGVQPGHDLPARERFDEQVRLTRSLARSAADLIVWGESSIGIGLDPDEATLQELTDLSDEVGAPLLVNVDARRGEGGIYKSSTLVTATGVAARYDKMRLVPFGEYIPFRRVLGWLSAVSDAAAEDRKRGDGLALMGIDGDVGVGPLVCFESAFPDMSRNLVQMGADLIVIQSATTTFQESWAPEQHASLAALRAVETGRPVVHATLTGESSVFDASGRRLATVPTSQRSTYEVTVPLVEGTTPFVRWGDWVLVTAAVALIAWVAFLRFSAGEADDRRDRDASQPGPRTTSDGDGSETRPPPDSLRS